MTFPFKYKNGNCEITIFENGTRIITTDDDFLKPNTPFNIDIRVSNSCSFGYNEKTNSSFCYFCHESAITNGKQCDYLKLKQILNNIPKGTELAIGSNDLTEELIDFIKWSHEKDFIVNLTINQGHLKRDLKAIQYLINNKFIKGLGVSYRESLKWDIPESILNYEHTIFHVICGIDDFNNVFNLKDFGVKKILILGEKDFGFNKHKVNLKSTKHEQWFWWVGKLFDMFDVVSFDNLSLEQLKLERFFTKQSWDLFNNEEHSMYINAVDEYFSPSSRSDIKKSFKDITLEKFFSQKY